jgi:hypothetical protein
MTGPKTQHIVDRQWKRQRDCEFFGSHGRNADIPVCKGGSLSGLLARLESLATGRRESRRYML